jgi:hypothetical protein
MSELMQTYIVQKRWNRGFGTIDSVSLVNAFSDNRNLTQVVLLANLPQVVLSVLYFL